jgi:glycosyltransferase involved in cell wall biosynthesis
MPKVSVIVITYNQKDFIRQTLDGVMTQETDFPFEILVGDDCSTDGTTDILREYGDKIKLFIRQKNLGASYNIYDLIMKVKGEYIAVCEGDDYWIDPLKLQKQVNYLDKHREYIGCCHKFNTVNERNEKIHKRLSWIKHKKVFSLKDFGGINMPSQISSFVFRNCLHGCTSIYEIDPMISDRTITLYLLTQGFFYCFPERFMNYRVSIRNTTGIRYKGNTDWVRDEFILTQKLKELAQEESIPIDFTQHLYELYAVALLKKEKKLLHDIKTEIKKRFSLLKVFIELFKTLLHKLEDIING